MQELFFVFAQHPLPPLLPPIKTESPNLIGVDWGGEMLIAWETEP